MATARVGDLNIHYDIHGQGAPLVMIMGLGGSSAAWDPTLVEELAASFRVVTFDNRGTGLSDKPDVPYSIAMMADDTAGLLDAIDIPRAHIFGVSMGGMIAQEFALRHPDRVAALVLGCTTAGGTHAVPPPPESMSVLTAPREGLAPEEIVRRGWPIIYTPAYIESHRAELEAAIRRVLENPTPPFAYQRQLEGTMTLHTYDRLGEIKAPTLVITGAQDVLIPAKNSEIIAERIPGAKLHLIPNAGHGFVTEGREEFLSVFVPFLEEHAMGQ